MGGVRADREGNTYSRNDQSHRHSDLRIAAMGIRGELIQTTGAHGCGGTCAVGTDSAMTGHRITTKDFGPGTATGTLMCLP